MRIASRRKTIAFFVVLGICLVALAVALNVGWIILNWRQGVLLVLGVIFFLAIILGMILNTGFLVREIRLNEQHDSFINAVTHELKTPITSIRLYLETLQRREVDEEQRRKFYSLMLMDTDRLLGTVEQVLRAGQSGHKLADPYRVEIDFDGLVRECIELAQTRHHLPPEVLHYESAANGSSSGTSSGMNGNNSGTRIEVSGDPEELRTAVSNVLDNAIKYSRDNVDVSVKVEIPDEKHVRLRVRDHGIGIPPEELKRIFKRFYRVRSRAASRVKGTGLGLFIVRAVAKKHGGTVSAESAGEGSGTTVILELPRSRA
jgi:two-component system, OmpR family, sensor histidine kinase SenX3